MCVRRVHILCAQTTLERKEDAITGHTVCMCGLRCKQSNLFLLVWIYVGRWFVIGFFFFSSQAIFSPHKIRKESDGDNNLNVPCGQLFLLLNWSVTTVCFWVLALRQVKCIRYVQYRIMIGVQKGKSSIWQAVNISLWKKKKKNCHFVYSERKHGETEFFITKCHTI